MDRCLLDYHIKEHSGNKTRQQQVHVPWIRVNMGREYTQHWIQSTAAARVLFGAGIAGLPDKDSRSLSNQVQKVALGLRPKAGQYQPPSIALLEQATSIPWDARVRRDNTTLLASVRAPGKTLPKEFMRNLTAHKLKPHISGIKGVSYTKNKFARKQKCMRVLSGETRAELKALHIAALRTKGDDSITRQYCLMNRGKFPTVLKNESQQIKLERQALGMVEYPLRYGEGSTPMCACGEKNGFIHVAFKCRFMSEPRDMLIARFDKIVDSIKSNVKQPLEELDNRDQN